MVYTSDDLGLGEHVSVRRTCAVAVKVRKNLNIFRTNAAAKQLSSTHSHSHFVVCCRMINCMQFFGVKVVWDCIDTIVDERRIRPQ